MDDSGEFHILHLAVETAAIQTGGGASPAPQNLPTQGYQFPIFGYSAQAD